jgi:NADH-ubiquinone oxidoreductase chain 1
VAETNRTPFDFSEGESELVSGFNIEYGALGFTLIFMAEYSIIIFFSTLSAVIFLTPVSKKALLRVSVVILGFFWVWLRSTYPRYRYDKLINIA